MFFPVFTKIRSVKPDAGPLFRPAAFTPLAFLLWNLGDLGGRMATMLPCSPRLRPLVLFVLAAARIAQLPLYLLCNIGGRGAAITSDFYLFVVELFGLSNGWLGSVFMMASGEWVDQGEREAAGGFMGLSRLRLDARQFSGLYPIRLIGPGVLYTVVLKRRRRS